MVQGDGGNDEIERAGIVALITTALAEAGGIEPELRRRGQQRQCGKLRLELRSLLWGCMSQDLEGHGFAQAGGGIENPGLYGELARQRCFGAGEVDPE